MTQQAQLSQKINYCFGFKRINSGKKSKYQIPIKIWKIVKGDQVCVISGKDKGKKGEVLKVYRKRNRVIVKDVNIKLKRVKSDPENNQKSGIRQILHPVHISNVALIDPELGVPTRIKIGYLADGKKVRISKKSGSIIEKPTFPYFNPAYYNKDKIDGLLDTSPAKSIEITYKGEDFLKIKKEFDEFIKEKERKEKLLVFKE